MIEGAGFQGFTPDFVKHLCNAGSLRAAEEVMSRNAEQLWRMALGRCSSY
jgi:hypothetical protein